MSSAKSNETITIENFLAYPPMNRFVHLPTAELWPAGSVNACLGRVDGVLASTWLMRNRRISASELGKLRQGIGRTIGEALEAA